MSAREAGGYVFALLSFFAILIVGALLLIILDLPIDMLHTAASNSSYQSQTSQTGLSWVMDYWAAVPFIIALYAMYKLIGDAAFYSRP